ncbi:hypothetical protein K1X13_16880 [Nocardioides sp. WL0053]|uniref:PepSY domain-containing protein n=1 Tax=Nocardioides jiangsuensis TaxID=2866161 RepID=A0ABS7RP37_9ACTN|nr:hypothetical protein [Nocardioides jiangsuensis]MBY9076511.1 hypothetical protein [Nocardioides jiangsuensis]
MKRTTKAIAFGVTTLAAIGVGTGIAVAAIVDDDADDTEQGNDVSISGKALDRAKEAALAHTGQGTVVDTEVEDDAEGYYEVEVELGDGSVTEVELSSDFKVLGTESEEAEGQDDD